MTLVESVVAMAVGSVMLGGLMVTSTSLQRWFSVADYTIACQQDQATALDYLARDLRRSSAVAVQNGDRKLVLTIPDQTARAADATLQPPTIANGLVTYGTTPATVSYYVQGAAFLRDDGTATITLSTNVDEFHTDLTSLPSITLKLLFKPAPHRTVDQQVVTTLRLRNLATRLQ